MLCPFLLIKKKRMLCPILTSLLLIWLQTSSWFSTGHLIDIGTLLSLSCLVLSDEKRHEVSCYLAFPVMDVHRGSTFPAIHWTWVLSTSKKWKRGGCNKLLLPLPMYCSLWIKVFSSYLISSWYLLWNKFSFLHRSNSSHHLNF